MGMTQKPKVFAYARLNRGQHERTLQKTDIWDTTKCDLFCTNCGTSWETKKTSQPCGLNHYISVSVLDEILRDLYQACEQDKDCHGGCCDRIDKFFPSELLEAKP